MGFCRSLTCLNVDEIIKLPSIVQWWLLRNVKLSLKWITKCMKKIFQNSFLGILIKYWWNIALYSKFHARFGNEFIFLLTCLIRRRMYSHICFYCFIYRGKYFFRLHGINNVWHIYLWKSYIRRPKFWGICLRNKCFFLSIKRTIHHVINSIIN